MPNRFEFEIYSDFNCTWCYFDKGSIKRLRNEYDIRVVWRAFPLHPDIPEDGLLIEELFGNNFPVMNDKIQQLEKKASELGLPLARRTAISDSRLSQELGKWAETKGKSDEYRDAIYEAYFAHGLNIADPSVLLDAVETSQLSREEAQSVIETRLFSQAVDDDWEKSEELKIMVAPTYILNQDKLIGSQPYGKLEELMLSNGVSRKLGR
ncbi:MAG: DsbA family protein [Desulfobacterium sp.]|nr:DsbA family protein [Desulfobacterium sp.]